MLPSAALSTVVPNFERAAQPGILRPDHLHALTGHRQVPVGVDGAGRNSRNVHPAPGDSVSWPSR